MASFQALYLKLDDYKSLRLAEQEDEPEKIKFEPRFSEDALVSGGAGLKETSGPGIVESLSLLNTFNIGNNVPREKERPANVEFNPIAKLRELNLPMVKAGTS